MPQLRWNNVLHRARQSHVCLTGRALVVRMDEAPRNAHSPVARIQEHIAVKDYLRIFAILLLTSFLTALFVVGILYLGALAILSIMPAADCAA